MTRGGAAGAILSYQVVAALSGVAVQVVLARALTTAQYGQFAFLGGVAASAAVLAQLNLGLWLSRESAARPGEALDLWAAARRLAWATSLASAVLVFAYVLCVDGRGSVLLGALAAGAAVAAQAQAALGYGVATGLQRLPAVLPWLIGGRVLSAALVLAAAGLGWASVVVAFAARAVGDALTAAGQVVRLGAGKTSGAVPVGQVARTATPFALQQAFAVIYISSDLLVLQWYTDYSTVATYQVAAVLVVQLPVFSTLVGRTLLPHLSRLPNPRGAAPFLSLGLRLLIGLALPIAVGGLMLGGDLLAAVFGAPFRAAGTVFQVLVLAVPLSLVKGLFGAALSGLGQQPMRALGAGVAAAANLALNIALVPSWGALGAAMATVAAECLVLAIFALALWRTGAGFVISAPLIRSCVAAAVMGAAVWVAVDLGVWARLALGGVTYLSAAMLVRALTPEDVRALRRL